MAAPRVTNSRPQRTTTRPGRPAYKPRPKPGISDGGSPGLGHVPVKPPKPGLVKPVTPAASHARGWGAPAAPKPAIAPAAAPAVAPEGQHAAPDSTYNTQYDQATKKGTEGLASLNQQETDIKHDFGIDDPTNPFSRAEGLKKSYLARQKGLSAGLASQGQLYSGTHERAMAKTRFEQEQAYNELRTAYTAAMGGVNSAKQNLANMTQEEQDAAFTSWLNRAEDTMPPPPAEEDDSSDDSTDNSSTDRTPSPSTTDVMTPRAPAAGENTTAPATVHTTQAPKGATRTGGAASFTGTNSKRVVGAKKPTPAMKNVKVGKNGLVVVKPKAKTPVKPKGGGAPVGAQRPSAPAAAKPAPKPHAAPKPAPKKKK